MKLVTYQLGVGESALGVVVEGEIHDLRGTAAALGLDLPGEMIAFLELGDDGMETAQRALDMISNSAFPSVPLESATLLAPIPRPRKLLATAGNYQMHIKEGRGDSEDLDKVKATPRLFLKPSSSVIGPGAPILLPSISDTVDYELELGVVIGKAGRDVPLAEAPSHIAGYTVFNDVSARQLLIAEGRDEREGDAFFDWLLGKWPDAFAPMGPYLVTTDEVGDPHDLSMKLWVNGELRQDGTTADMIWNCFDLVEFISRFVTLEPGDVIATGTPAGVGAARGIYLQDGDLVEGEIEGLGWLANPVVAPTGPGKGPRR